MKINYLNESLEDAIKDTKKRFDDQIKSINDTDIVANERDEQVKHYEDAMKEIDLKAPVDGAPKAEKPEDAVEPDPGKEIKGLLKEEFSDDLWDKLPSAVKSTLNDAWDSNKTNSNFFSAYLQGVVDCGVISEEEYNQFIQSNEEDGFVEALKEEAEEEEETVSTEDEVPQIDPEDGISDEEEQTSSFVDTLTDEQKSKIDDISERYIVTSPVSGSWDTEEEHERNAIKDELGFTDEQVDAVMKDYLFFDDDDVDVDNVEEDLMEGRKSKQYGKANMVTAELDSGTDDNSKGKLKFSYLKKDNDPREAVPKINRYTFHDVGSTERNPNVEVSLDDIDLVVHADNIDFAKKVAAAYDVETVEDDKDDLRHYKSPHTLRFKFKEEDWGEDDID